MWDFFLSTLRKEGGEGGGGGDHQSALYLGNHQSDIEWSFIPATKQSVSGFARQNWSVSREVLGRGGLDPVVGPSEAATLGASCDPVAEDLHRLPGMRRPWENQLGNVLVDDRGSVPREERGIRIRCVGYCRRS